MKLKRITEYRPTVVGSHEKAGGLRWLVSRRSRFERGRRSDDRPRDDGSEPPEGITIVYIHPTKLMRVLVVDPDMTTVPAAVGSALAQAGLLSGQFGQLLVGLVVVAVVIVVGKFVLSLAWRLVTIGVVVVAVLYLLSTLGLI